MGISEIKDIIRNRRIELGLTMKEVAAAVGVSEGTVSRWEAGNISNMKRNRITALAKVLNIQPSIIMGFDEDEDTHVTNRLTPKNERDIQKRLNDILSDLNSDAALSFYNGDEPMDEETIALLKASIESSVTLAKLKAKKKFTTKKNQRQE